ncbi:hypothetical protein OAJ20_04445 [Candidatus Pelagibacter sp.]|nr:hypothetical protein [Candidatus Pelagibacter sp.]
MKNITIIIFLFFITTFCKSFAIEVSSLEAEKRLEFSEFFPKKICNKIYEESSFGKENKLSEEVELKAYINLKRLNVDETNSNLLLYFDQRSYNYKDPKLGIIIFNNISDDFSDEVASLNKKIKDAGTQKIVVCEYDLEKSISEGKFFDFKIIYDNATKVETNVSPKILIYFDGTIEYLYFNEKVEYNASEFDYKKYPFDEQSFKISVSSQISEDLSFRMSDKFKLLNTDIKKLEFSNISSPGWSIKQYNTYPVLDYLGKVYSDYAKPSVKSDITIDRNSISFVFKFIMPIVMIIMVTYFTIFVPFDFNRISVCITLVLSLVAFNLVAAASRIPDMPYLNVFDWFIFTAYINAISVLIITFIESIYIGQFMGYSKKDILNVPRHEKKGLLKFRKISGGVLLTILIVSSVIGYSYIYK